MEEQPNFEPFDVCPICGFPLENIFRDPEGSLVTKNEDGIDEVFLCDDGLFRFIPDDEHAELLHIDWHHQH